MSFYGRKIFETRLRENYKNGSFKRDLSDVRMQNQFNMLLKGKARVDVRRNGIRISVEKPFPGILAFDDIFNYAISNGSKGRLIIQTGVKEFSKLDGCYNKDIVAKACPKSFSIINDDYREDFVTVQELRPLSNKVSTELGYTMGCVGIPYFTCVIDDLARVLGIP